MWVFASVGAGNLGPRERAVIEIALLTIAVVVGCVCGALISRRRSKPSFIPFAATIGAIGGGICGASFAVLMGIAFVTTYGGAPVSLLDGILVLLAYPVFGLLGAMVGGLFGAILGALGGYLAIHVAPLSPAERL